MTLASGDEVRHISTRKPSQRPSEILIPSAKRLLQQYRAQIGRPIVLRLTSVSDPSGRQGGALHIDGAPNGANAHEIDLDQQSCVESRVSKSGLIVAGLEALRSVLVPVRS